MTLMTEGGGGTWTMTSYECNYVVDDLGTWRLRRATLDHGV